LRARGKCVGGKEREGRGGRDLNKYRDYFGLENRLADKCAKGFFLALLLFEKCHLATFGNYRKVRS